VKINTKIIGLLFISFFVVSALFSFTSVNSLQQNQTKNINLFKEEYLELVRELFVNSSDLFFYTLDSRNSIHNEDLTANQELQDFVEEMDPQGNKTFIIDIDSKQYLENYANPDLALLVDQTTVENILQENILNQKEDFDLDNFDEFKLDETNVVAPSKVHLRVYNDAGLIIGYYKTFITAKVRIQFIERQNEALFRSHLLSLIVIFISIVVIITIFTILSMRNMVIKPLKKIDFGLKQVKAGKLETRLDIKKKDEIGKIASAFNDMTKDLHKSRKELEDYAKNLEEKVTTRTKELDEKNKKLQRMNEHMVGRELAMVKLKDEIAKLKEGRTDQNV
jgi:methyl-accepting chemotaxis protein